MKWMIRVDMEGVTGVVNMNQVVPGASEYTFGRSMMMHDLQAVLSGLLQSEDDEVWLYDIHFHGTNVDLERLDPRVTAICGKPHYSPLNRAYLDESFDGLLLLGLHAKADTPGALLNHNYEHDIRKLSVNGIVVGEIGLEALMAGECGVPLVLVTADSEGAAETERLLPGTPAVSVKRSLGETAAACYPPAYTAALLKAGAERCAEAAQRLQPFTIPGPITLEMSFSEGALLDRLRSRLGGSFLDNGRLVLHGHTVVEAWEQYLHAKSD